MKQNRSQRKVCRMERRIMMEAVRTRIAELCKEKI